MKDITTSETSVRLKEAGFPQPTPEPGQFWYTSAGLLCWIARKELGSTFILCDTTGTMFRTLYVEFSKDLLFAPTATDILRGLPSYSIFFSAHTKQWFVEYDEMAITHNEHNPAEAAAEAWLNLNEK